MNPIPLTDPAGVVRAYACGGCGQLQEGHGQRIGLRRPIGKQEKLSEARRSWERASRCCSCSTCGASIAPRVDGRCKACDEEAASVERWRWFCDTWWNVGYLASRGIARPEDMTREDRDEVYL